MKRSAIDLVAALVLTAGSLWLVAHDVAQRYSTRRFVDADVALLAGYALGVLSTLAWARWMSRA